MKILGSRGGGSSVKFQKFLTFSDFSFVPKKFSSMTIRTSAYNFYDFMIEPIFIHFVGGGSGGRSPPENFGGVSSCFFIFFEGGTGAKPPEFFGDFSIF